MRLRGLLVVAFIAFTSSLFAQDVQLAPDKAPRPPAPIEKVGKKDRYVLFPVLVKSPEYRWGAGAAGTIFFKIKKDDTTSRTSSFKAVTFVTLRKQLVAATEGNIYFPNEKYILYVVSSATKFPDKFWGLGNVTSNSALENYAIEQFSIFPKLMRRVYSSIYAGVGYEFQHVWKFDYDRSGNSIFDKQDIVGRNGGWVSGPGATVTWDNRNHAFAPSKGFYVQFYVGVYGHAVGSDFNFAVRNLDVRKYVALSKNVVLAFQANLISTSGDVPIRQLTNIGSNSYMRGYYEGRYTDKNLLAFQSELRFPLYKRFAMVTFAGVGRVGGSLGEVFIPTHLKPSIGAGLRFALSPQEKLHLRMDAGFGNKSNGTYLNMGEAF